MSCDGGAWIRVGVRAGGLGEEFRALEQAVQKKTKGTGATAAGTAADQAVSRSEKGMRKPAGNSLFHHPGSTKRVGGKAHHLRPLRARDGSGEGGGRQGWQLIGRQLDS